jgi:hypothetical protein
VAQLWDTGYGRALLVKTSLLAIVGMLGWLNRSRLVPRHSGAVGALRRNVFAELLLLAGVVTAVAFLTDLAPGRQLARAAQPAARPRPIEPPPPGATVLAGQSGELAVGLTALPHGRVEATILGPDGNGVDDLAVSFRTSRRLFGAKACGPGCYRALGRVSAGRVTVRPGPSPAVSFVLPTRARPASKLVVQARRAFQSLRSLVIHERLASSPLHRISATWRIVAPDRLAYVTSAGNRAVVVGAHRWDKRGAAPWRPSPQTPLSLPPAEWGRRVLAAKTVGWRRTDARRAPLVSFFDPSLPAWFELALDPRTKRPLALTMIAAAHFMRHRYSDFNRPQRIVPPRP